MDILLGNQVTILTLAHHTNPDPDPTIEPISGLGALAKNPIPANGGDTFTFTFPGGVEQFGATVLSKAAADLGIVTGVALFSGGGSVTSTFNIGSTLAEGTSDTFFGFVAPPGQSILQVSIDPGINDPDRFTALNDVGFVVPEPGFGLFTLAFAGWFLRRTRAGVM